MAKTPAPKTVRRRKKLAHAGPVGLSPLEVRVAPPESVQELGRAIEDDGGAVLATYRDPPGGHWLVLAALRSCN
jgi:ParB family chromosome partitioning protein